MNILFLSLLDFESINEHSIYTDLLREFHKNGHSVYAISPVESNTKGEVRVIREKNSVVLKVPTGKIQKTNIIEKGINTVLIETRYKRAIKKHFGKIRFDLVLYPTPPITLVGAVNYVKKRDNAKTYLLLKDIFPQNAVDIGMMSTVGGKAFLYKYFRKKEKKLYLVSDYIGCMSKENVNYVVKHNPEINTNIVEVCPNSIEIRDMYLSEKDRNKIRQKYNIPTDKIVFVYGGNLGKPQGIPFIMECLKACMDKTNVYVLIVGDGTEYEKLKGFFERMQPSNMKLMRRLPKEDYDQMVAACDVGMIFLDHRFTIPNFPSRLLSYMQAKIPILACTDPNTDIGKVIVDGDFGWWCESNDVNAFEDIVKNISNYELKKMGVRGYEYLSDNYGVDKGYRIITEQIGR